MVPFHPPSAATSASGSSFSSVANCRRKARSIMHLAFEPSGTHRGNAPPPGPASRSDYVG